MKFVLKLIQALLHGVPAVAYTMNYILYEKYYLVSKQPALVKS